MIPKGSDLKETKGWAVTGRVNAFTNHWAIWVVR
jgi:hypothetical protein